MHWKVHNQGQKKLTMDAKYLPSSRRRRHQLFLGISDGDLLYILRSLLEIIYESCVLKGVSSIIDWSGQH